MLAGYGIGALRFRYAAAVLALFVFGLMIPIEAGLVPLYYVWRALGLTDSYVAIIVTEVGYMLPFGVFWMAAAFRSLPRELLEAARVDGATSWRTLRLRRVADRAPGDRDARGPAIHVDLERLPDAADHDQLGAAANGAR